DTLTYCPAPGQKLTDAKTRVKRTLPPNFVLDDAWLRRLYQIATSTTALTTEVGICGTCLLHAFQIVAELQQYQATGPLPSGGYFFDTAEGRDPMISFQARYPDIYRTMRNIPTWRSFPIMLREGRNEIDRRLIQLTIRAILPNYNWEASDIARSQEDILNSIYMLLMAPPGTIWIAVVHYRFLDGRETGHAMPIIRTLNGAYVIPTNTSINYDTFVQRAREVITTARLYSMLTAPQPQAEISYFVTFRLSEIEEEPLSVVMSQRNCTGDGEDRRGNREPPRSATVNQCLSGRCTIQ
ncbi:DUF1561 family protein, partial [Bartonella sp. A05]|uniref:DUF1561 family protein n=1 Tax=Bartonella sp. A05 TaxID=2967261 RepID=UPI0022A973DF